MSDVDDPDWDALGALGFFVIGWSVLESTLEAAIAQQLGVSAEKGAIVTSSLQFKGRVSMLKSLLSRSPEKNEEALQLLTKLNDTADRNDIIHGVSRWENGRLIFHRRMANGKLKSNKVEHDFESLMRLTISFSQTASSLQSALGLSDEQLVGFLQRAQRAANKG